MADAKLLKYLAANSLPPRHSVQRLLDDHDHPLRKNLLLALERVDTSTPIYRKLVRKFEYWPEVHSPDLRARAWIYQGAVINNIASMRLEVLLEDYDKSRPVPYEHDALSDVLVDADRMIPMSCFAKRYLNLTRKDYTFTVLTPLPARHSSYFIEKKLFGSRHRNSCFIRPDPFLFGKENEFIPIQYRMWVYGTPLDWDRIKKLREIESGRWMNDDIDSNSYQFTEYLWRPTEKEIHFTLEELPIKESIKFRGSRYFHSIYNRKEDVFSHVDAAIRVYGEDELRTRLTIKLNDSDAVKIGKRIKIFKINSDVEKEEWSNLVASYFVGNEDVIKYFERREHRL